MNEMHTNSIHYKIQAKSVCVYIYVKRFEILFMFKIINSWYHVFLLIHLFLLILALYVYIV